MNRQRGNLGAAIALGISLGAVAGLTLNALNDRTTGSQCFAAGFPEYATTNAGNRYCIGNGRAVPLHSMQKDAQ